MIRGLSLNTIGVSDLKTFWEIFKPILFGLLAVVCVFSLVVISIVIGVYIKHLDDPKETTAYIDYAPLPLNITYVEPELDLKQYAYIEDGLHKFEYHKLKGLSLGDFVGVNSVRVALFRDDSHKIILANPTNDFSIWDDWSIKEIQIQFEQAGETYVTNGIEVKNDFIRYVKEIDDTFFEEETSGTDTKTEKPDLGDSIGGGFCDLSVSFQESEYVEWKALISYDEYPNDVYIIEANILLFDPYPDVYTEYVEIPMGTPLYDFIVESIKNSK